MQPTAAFTAISVCMHHYKGSRQIYGFPKAHTGQRTLPMTIASELILAAPQMLSGREEDCDAPALLVRYHPDTPSDWRCHTGIVLMGESSHPFLP